MLAFGKLHKPLILNLRIFMSQWLFGLMNTADYYTLLINQKNTNYKVLFLRNFYVFHLFKYKSCYLILTLCGVITVFRSLKK